MELQCPKCSSNELRSCAVVWREGTTDARGAIVGGSFGSAGFQPAAASTYQQSQTLLAQQCAPPKKRGEWSIVWAMFFVIGGFNFLVRSNWILGIPLMLLGTYCVWLFMQARTYNREELPGALRRWEDTFVCSRCGEFVTAQESAQRSTEGGADLHPSA
jgi:transcription elongation factor Elf1